MRRAVLLLLVLGCKKAPRVEPPAAAPPPSVVGTYSGELTLFPGFAPSTGASKVTPPATRSTVDATVSIHSLRPGSGAMLGTLWIHSGEDNWKMEVIILHDNVRITGTRPLTCGGLETGGRIEAKVTGDVLHIEELFLEKPCKLGGVEHRFVQFDGRRPKPL